MPVNHDASFVDHLATNVAVRLHSFLFSSLCRCGRAAQSLSVCALRLMRAQASTSTLNAHCCALRPLPFRLLTTRKLTRNTTGRRPR